MSASNKISGSNKRCDPQTGLCNNTCSDGKNCTEAFLQQPNQINYYWIIPAALFIKMMIVLTSLFVYMYYRKRDMLHATASKGLKKNLKDTKTTSDILEEPCTGTRGVYSIKYIPLKPPTIPFNLKKKKIKGKKNNKQKSKTVQNKVDPQADSRYLSPVITPAAPNKQPKADNEPKPTKMEIQSDMIKEVSRIAPSISVTLASERETIIVADTPGEQRPAKIENDLDKIEELPPVGPPSSEKRLSVTDPWLKPHAGQGEVTKQDSQEQSKLPDSTWIEKKPEINEKDVDKNKSKLPLTTVPTPLPPPKNMPIPDSQNELKTGHLDAEYQSDGNIYSRLQMKGAEAAQFETDNNDYTKLLVPQRFDLQKNTSVYGIDGYDVPKMMTISLQQSVQEMAKSVVVTRPPVNSCKFPPMISISPVPLINNTDIKYRYAVQDLPNPPNHLEPNCGTLATDIPLENAVRPITNPYPNMPKSTHTNYLYHPVTHEVSGINQPITSAGAVKTTVNPNVTQPLQRSNASSPTKHYGSVGEVSPMENHFPPCPIPPTEEHMPYSGTELVGGQGIYPHSRDGVIEQTQSTYIRKTLPDGRKTETIMKKSQIREFK